MASLHNGRRPALIPGIESLSPEEVQDVLCNRIGRPVIPPPNPDLAVAASQGQRDRQGTRRLHKFPQPPSEAISKPDSPQSLPESPDAKREGMALFSMLSRGDADTSVRWTQAEQENARGRHWKPDTINLGKESKRKHAAFAQDEQRRYSNEIWEDIPHMSEIVPDRGFRTTGKDVFGLRGQNSLFVEACRDSSSERSESVCVCMLTDADRTVIRDRRGYSNLTQQGAQPYRHFTSRYIRLESTFLELLIVLAARPQLGKPWR